MNDNSLKYYTYEKWSLPEEFESSYLKDKPKEVKDTYYLNKNDSTLNISGELNNYDVWKFDSDGNVLFHKFSMEADSFLVITKYSYTEEGLQVDIFDNDSSIINKNSAKTFTTKRQTDVLQMHFGLDGPEYSIISFSANGNVEKQKFVADTNKLGNISRTQINYYNNNMIQKKELITNGGIYKIENFFYSKENFLDSIYIYDNEKLTSKENFYNNQFGDPINLFELDSLNDTIKIARIKYEYDQHHNWIKQLVEEENKNIDTNLVDVIRTGNLGNSLSVREIKY